MTVSAVLMGDRPFPSECDQGGSEMDVFAFVLITCCIELFMCRLFAIWRPIDDDDDRTTVVNRYGDSRR